MRGRDRQGEMAGDTPSKPFTAITEVLRGAPSAPKRGSRGEGLTQAWPCMACCRANGHSDCSEASTRNTIDDLLQACTWLLAHPFYCSFIHSFIHPSRYVVAVYGSESPSPATVWGWASRMTLLKQFIFTIALVIAQMLYQICFLRTYLCF